MRSRSGVVEYVLVIVTALIAAAVTLLALYAGIFMASGAAS